METNADPTVAERPLDDAVVTLLVANHRRFLSFLEKRVGNRDDAEEILQAAFAKAVDKREGLREEDRAVAWFYRLLRNAVIDHYRRRAARDRMLDAQARAVPDDVVLDEEIHGVVCACFVELLPTLKGDYARILRAVDLDARPIADVADELGITTNNAGVRLHRARQALRRRLEQTCSTCAEHGCFDCTCEKH